MPLTEEQLALRRTGITATDAVKILGLNPWSGPFAVLQEKLGNAPRFKGNARTRAGERAEPGLRQDFAEAHGCEVVEPVEIGTVKHRTEDWAMSTPDGLIPLAGIDWHNEVEAGLEIKVVGERRARDWGEPGTDQVPKYVYPQCSWGMFIFNAPVWYVVAQIDLEPYEYVLRRDAELEKKMVNACRGWWERHVVGGEPLPPDGSTAYAKDLQKRFRRHDADIIRPSVGTSRAIHQLREVLADAARLQERERLLKQEIMLAISEHAGIETGEAKPITWKRCKDSTRVDWEAVAAELRLVISSLLAGDEASRKLVEDRLQAVGVATIDEIIDAHTVTKPGSRRFLVPPTWDRPKR